MTYGIVTAYSYSNLKLPDGGTKLKSKLEQIKSLLEAQKVNANNITDKVSGLSLNDKVDIRKETVLRSSQTEVYPANLLRAHPTDNHMVTNQLSHVS